MTTITKEWLQQTIAEFENTRDDIPFGLSDDDAKILIVLKRALASLDAEPAGYHVIKECGKVGCSVATLEEAEKTRDFWNKKWTIRPYFYSAPPVQETGVYQDMLNIIGLLEKNEWAEHCTSTVLGSLLESEITRLVGKEHPVPVVPDECPAELLAFCEQVIDSRITANAKADELWNACRAAMLQAGNHTEQHLDMVDHSGDANEKGSDGTFIDEGTKQAGNSPVIPDGWISCSERMPAQDDWVLIYSKYGEYLAGQVQGEYVELNDGTLSWLGAALHWMPLPEPPQE
ncbi:DUF551 domain-containing protein [Salmonella enterica]|nr:DUF551 domain-containing protein [Salmonella enterica]